jgi:UDP-hydrolysing UDP-N-acetyl-D-glucosamine 2-epimerase
LRKIAVVTVSRSDYGIYRPILRRVQGDPDLQLQLIAGGMHLAPEFGMTIREIESDGVPIAARVEMLLATDSPEGAAQGMGLGTIGFAQAYARLRPDIVVLLGDRMEMHAAAVAAVPFNLAMAHIHGGESSEGAIDEVFRHSITKMSHVHFVAADAYAERVAQMGEEGWRITVAGAPGLDNLRELPLLTPAELREKTGLRLPPGMLLATYHPVTRQPQATLQEFAAMLEAVERTRLPVAFTYPSADVQGRTIIAMLEAFLRRYPQGEAAAHLGTQAYFSLMRHAAAMVGNSSSGIIEAASFALPVVNVGDRQAGRVRGENVIDAEGDRQAITAAIERALAPEFRARISGMRNPYQPNGAAAAVIVDRLKSLPLDEALLRKRLARLRPVAVA